MKDNKSAKSRNGHEVETEDCRQIIEELSTIFSRANFQTDIETEEKKIMKEDNEDLDIGYYYLFIFFSFCCFSKSKLFLLLLI